MSALQDKQPHRRAHGPPPNGALRNVYWDLQQALSWVLSRDLEVLHQPSKDSAWAAPSRYCAELVVAVKGPGPRVAAYDTLNHNQRRDIDQVTAAIRPRYAAAMQREDGNGGWYSEYEEVEQLLPSTARWAIAWAHFVLNREREALQQRLDPSRVELINRIKDGSIALIGRPNGAGDPRLIEAHFWPYYGMFFTAESSICAAPTGSKRSDLVRRSKERSVAEQPTIWFSLLVPANEVCRVWPKEAGMLIPTLQVEHTRRRTNPETEDRLRDVHARLRQAIRKWRRLSARPSKIAVADELARDIGKQVGYSYETLRKMLAGKYKPFQRLHLDPLTDW